MGNRGEKWKEWHFIFLGSKITVDGDCSHEIKRRLFLRRKVMINLDSILKKQRHYFADKGLSSQSYAMVFPVVMYGCESWTIKKAEHRRIDAFGVGGLNQSWMFIGRTDAEAEAPILWPPDARSRLFRKDLDVGKDWGQEEKGVTEDEMVGWHHWLNGHESEQTRGESEWTGQTGTLQFMGSQKVRHVLATKQHVIDSIGEYTKNISQFGKKIKRSPRWSLECQRWLPYNYNGNHCQAEDLFNGYSLL